MSSTWRAGWPWAAALLGVMAVGCADGVGLEPADPLRPQSAITFPGDDFEVGTNPNNDIGNAYLCVVSPVGGIYRFGISAVPGKQEGGVLTANPVVLGTPVDVGAGTCVRVAYSPDARPDDSDQISADETQHPGTVQLQGVMVHNMKWTDRSGNTQHSLISTPGGDPATGESSFEGATKIVYTYEEIPQGGEGCTPGYWKQSHHFDSWEGYNPDDLFSSVFDDAFPGKTLVEVLGQGGGGLKALGRHVVAALLNASSGGVDFDWTEQEVIDAFNAVFPGGDYEGLKDELVTLNEQGCPLN